MVTINYAFREISCKIVYYGPGLSGKIVFDWVISPSGRVGSARQVSSSMRSAAVATCILRLIRSWRFPKPVGGSVTVRYPFVFRVSGF